MTSDELIEVSSNMTTVLGIIENNFLNKNLSNSEFRMLLTGISMIIGRIENQIIDKKIKKIKVSEKKNLMNFINQFNNQYKISNNCYRCGGSGYLPQFSHVMNGICFSCGGKKMVDLSTLEKINIDDHFDNIDWEDFDFDNYDY